MNTELAEKRVKRVVDGEGGNAGGAGRSGVFVAESGGWVRDICLEVCMLCRGDFVFFFFFFLVLSVSF